VAIKPLLVATPEVVVVEAFTLTRSQQTIISDAKHLLDSKKLVVLIKDDESNGQLNDLDIAVNIQCC